MIALDSFPILQQGNEVHLNLKGGTLFADLKQYPLDPEQADFLKLCDGKHRLKEIIPKTWSEDYGDIMFLVLISQMLDTGRLLLRDEATLYSPRLTGSRSAYIPPHMTIELTAGCNLKCRHCYRESDSTRNQYMPTGDLLNILQRLSDAGLRSVELTGGEPLLHRDFLEILSFCAERLELVGVLTNGTILSQDIAEKFKSMEDKLILSISLDGSTAAAHDLRRGVPGAFQQTVQNIKLLSELGLKVRVSMCVDEESFGDIENTLLLARKLGAYAFSYSPVLPFGRARDWAPRLWNLDKWQAFQAERELAEKYKGFLFFTPNEELCDSDSGRKSCGAGYRTYAMDPWGFVRPCVTFSPDELVIGNLIERSVEDVFSHPATNVLADLPSPGEGTCKDCHLSSFCRYCILRGLRSSQIVSNCNWIHHTANHAILNYWSS